MPRIPNSLPDHISSARERIFDIKNNLLNRTLVVIFLLSILVLIPSFARIPASGFQISHVVHIILFGLLASIIVFRRKIGFTIRLSIFMAGLVAGGLSGFLSYGLMGLGLAWLLCAVTLISVFGNRDVSYGLLVLCLGIIGVFSVLYINGTLALSFDPAMYNTFTSSWLTHLLAFGVFAGMLISVTTGLYSNLRSIAEESMNQVYEINDLNTGLEKKVQLRTTEITRSNREKDRILGVVAHDINNKLVGIVGYLDMLAQDYDGYNEKERLEYIGRALEASNFAAGIVKELLDFSRSQNNEPAMVTESVDMGPFVRSTVECHLPRALEKKITLKTGSIADFSFCNINRVKLSRVIDNLVTNAIKFTPEGGAITVDIEKHREGIVMRFSDTGIGIPDSLKPNIFKPFSSSGRTGTADEKSTGLGLSISKEIVEQHSGKIWVESRKGEGSIFFLQLPKATEQNEEVT